MRFPPPPQVRSMPPDEYRVYRAKTIKDAERKARDDAQRARIERLTRAHQSGPQTPKV